jgi:hypothetical protein
MTGRPRSPAARPAAAQPWEGSQGRTAGTEAEQRQTHTQEGEVIELGDGEHFRRRISVPAICAWHEISSESGARFSS